MRRFVTALALAGTLTGCASVGNWMLGIDPPTTAHADQGNQSRNGRRRPVEPLRTPQTVRDTVYITRNLNSDCPSKEEIRISTTRGYDARPYIERILRIQPADSCTYRAREMLAAFSDSLWIMDSIRGQVHAIETENRSLRQQLADTAYVPTISQGPALPEGIIMMIRAGQLFVIPKADLLCSEDKETPCLRAADIHLLGDRYPSR